MESHNSKNIFKPPLSLRGSANDIPMSHREESGRNFTTKVLKKETLTLRITETGVALTELSYVTTIRKHLNDDVKRTKSLEEIFAERDTFPPYGNAIGYDLLLKRKATLKEQRKETEEKIKGVFEQFKKYFELKRKYDEKKQNFQ